VMVDPILGDGAADGGDDGLYVSAETARAIRDELIPLANVITPNRFELAWLSRFEIKTSEDAVKAARGLAPVVMCTSAPAALNEVSVICVTQDDAFSAYMPRIDPAPYGTGDVFAASALVERLTGARWRDAAARGMARISHVLDETRLAGDARDLLLTAQTLQTPLRAPALRRVGAQRPAWVMGLDGCKAGWAAVMVDLNGIEAPRRAVFEQFQEEIQVLCGLHHASIVQILGVYIDKRPRLDNPLSKGKPQEDAKAETKPAESAEGDKPKRSRSRSPKSDNKSKETVEAAEETTQPAPEQAAPKPRTDSKPKGDNKPREAQQQGRDNSQKGRNDKRGRGRNDHRGGNQVVGLGDHTPEFIGLSFDDRRNAT